MNTPAFLALGIAALSAGSISAQTNLESTTKCVQMNGRLMTIPVHYNTLTGEYTVAENGEERPFSDMYPTDATYAANATWFIAGDTIAVKWQKFRKRGLPKVLGATAVTKWGEYEGVPVYAEKPSLTFQKVIYIPVRTECEFQEYEWVEQARRTGRPKSRR